MNFKRILNHYQFTINATKSIKVKSAECAGRPPVLGPLTTRENDGLTELWQVLMAGFYTYGEFGRTKGGKQHFHSGVCCWAALKEL